MEATVTMSYSASVSPYIQENNRNGSVQQENGHPPIVTKIRDRTPFMEFCALCGRRIGRKMKMISAHGKQYHSECFRCHVCKKPLSIDNYEARIGALLCKPKCFMSPSPAKRNGFEHPRVERCVMCREVVTKAQRHKYVKEPLHWECFYCANCEKPLNVWKYTLIQDKPHCAPECRVSCTTKATENGFAKFNCQKCREPTSPSDRVNVLHQVYHQGCFVCQECGAGLNIWKFQLNGEELLCHPVCRNKPKAAPKPLGKLCCDVCDQMIQNVDRVSVENRSYHRQCLKCHLCGRQLDHWKFKQEGKKLSCTPQCNKQSKPKTSSTDQDTCDLCIGCQKPVSKVEKLITLSGVCHRECFKCYRCGQTLSIWKHQLKGGQTSCDSCSVEL